MAHSGFFTQVSHIKLTLKQCDIQTMRLNPTTTTHTNQPKTTTITTQCQQLSSRQHKIILAQEQQ
jgi:hypothetical protein